MATKYCLTGLIFAMVLSAQNAPQPQVLGDQSDPEDRNHGVARISLLNGDVSVRRGDSGDVVAANVNAPMLSGDGIQTGPSSRAEVQFDSANRVRLSALSEAQMGDLRAGAIQLQIAHGTAIYTVIGESQAQVEVSTPIAALRPVGRGAFRISVLDDGSAEFTVRAGQAEIFTNRGSQQLSAGQTMMLRGNPADPEYQIVSSPAKDEFDQFSETRDRELVRSTAYQHVSRDVPGAEDLDQYGRWSNDPNYGDVWVPNVAADWAPYQSGRWVWEDYYGWTWLSYDPWGWAPYHYGRWYRGPVGWAWVPGPAYARYAYRPALVSFFGFGAGAGFGFGFGYGNLGWVALAPFEPFHPWYGRGVYGRGITTVNVNVYNTYRNARVTGGVMGVSAQAFQSGAPGRYSHPGPGVLQNAGAVNGQLPVSPGSSHLRFNDRSTSVSARASSQSQRFVSRGGFAPVQRLSLSQQRQNMGRTAPAVSAAPSWQRFGTPLAGSAARTPSQSGGSGWNRFGSPSSATTSSARPVQISPSIVQQRQSAPAPSSTPQNRPSSSNSGGSGGKSSSHSSSSSSGSGHHGR